VASPEPNIHAEILKLARLLRVEPEELAYLEQVPGSDLGQLREQVADMLFSAHNQMLDKLAASSRLLPVALVALITERAFGPVLAARMAGVLEPPRAVAVAARLPTAFLADTARQLDPRRTRAIIAGIPAERIEEIARVLAEHQDFVTMGQAVGQLSSEALRASLSALDDEMLLRTAFVMDDKDRLPELAELLGHERLIGMIDVAERAGLEDEAIDLIAHLDDAQQTDLLAALRERDQQAHQQVLDRLAKVSA